MAAEELAGRIGQTAEACEALGVSRSGSTPTGDVQADAVLGRSEPSTSVQRTVDKAPAQVWATLLDEGIYHCDRTMYRILSEHGEVPFISRSSGSAEPGLVDITKLRGPVKWTYFYLYVILDIFSRYVTGWMLARRESAELARRLISESCSSRTSKPTSSPSTQTAAG